MPRWTNLELYRIAVLYQRGCPSRDELAEAFPRHTVDNTIARASALGLKRCPQQVRWLRIAHLHFSRREAEMRP